jgi:hypothetical protein
MDLRRTFSVLSFPFLLAGAASLVACVKVPDTVRAQFAAPETNDASNYRPGKHGKAAPVEDAPLVMTPPPSTSAKPEEKASARDAKPDEKSDGDAGPAAGAAKRSDPNAPKEPSTTTTGAGQ